MPYGSISVDQINNTTGYSLGAGNASLMKNRLINGAMAIDQRNAGASVTPNGYTYQLDRWTYGSNLNDKISVQQVTDAPPGFLKSVKLTSLSAYTITSGDRFIYSQVIEGHNTADIAYGTANALTCTLSFWVKCSLTGTFTCSLNNDTGFYSYVTTYTISSANTWTKISLTIPPSTAGLWNNGTTSGSIYIVFGLGSGSNWQTSTINTWQNTFYESATGRTALASTNGATWQMTGAQFEVGSVATGFEYRHYGQELALCQRYYQKLGLTSNQMLGSGITQTVSQGAIYCKYNTTMRASPTSTFYSLYVGDNWNYGRLVTSLSGSSFGTDSAQLVTTIAQSDMVAQRAMIMQCAGSTSYIDFSSEL